MWQRLDSSVQRAGNSGQGIRCAQLSPGLGRHIKGDIQAFGKLYKGPEDELADIKQAYLNCKGDTDQLTESVLCVQYPEEEPRVGNLIQ